MRNMSDREILDDQIGTCLNKEVEIDVTTWLHSSLDHIMLIEDKNILDKEIKRLCYLGVLKEGFSVYSSPLMLISRKVTKDKRVIMDFRHKIVKIARNNLASPLLKDTISVLGSSRFEVLSVLDLKDAFHSLRLLENSK